MKYKKGKSDVANAGGIAVLISLIALFIILYVLLLPPEARKELLGEESGLGIDKGVIGEGEKVYLSSFLGELSQSTRTNKVNHNVPAVNLFTTSERDLTSLSGYLQVDSGFISSKNQNLAFSLASPEKIKKATLYLFVEEAKGNLVLRLNGKEMYNNELRDNVQENIELPLNYLQENNNLEFGVSSPSWMFWKTNGYKIRYVKLRKETEITNRVVENTISIPNSEWGAVERGILKYSVYCDRREDSVLKIYLNDQRLYGDVPFCNIEANELEVDKSVMVAGVNRLRFETLDGDYLIEQISLRTILQDETEPEEVFSVSEEEYKDIRRGLKDIIAYFDFGIRGDRKLFDLFINDELIEIDTDKDIYPLKISEYIKKGGNSIRIKPSNTFEIIELRVELV